MRWCVWLLAKFCLWLRYSIRVQGWDEIPKLKKPILILPNHPGLIDPPILITTLWPSLRPRPVVYDQNFRGAFMRFLGYLLNILRVPYMEQASAKAREGAQAVVQAIIGALKAGDTIIIWPSGRIERNGVEVLGGVRALAEILQGVPEADVLLVRTRGVWGSSFSFAPTGQHPTLGGGMLAGLWTLLGNLIFFAPRRPVSITLQRLDRGQIPTPLTRETVNPFFEEWYNQGTPDGQEQPTFVPYHFLFGPRTHEFPKYAHDDGVDLNRITPETKAAVAQLLHEKLSDRELGPEWSEPTTTLDSLGLDSLDRMEVSLEIERRFGFHGEQVPVNVAQLWALAQGMVEKTAPKPPDPKWFVPPGDIGELRIEGDTVPAAFVNCALRHARDVVVADDLAGVLTFERMLIGTLLLARRFAKLEGENVGLMLPASAASSMIFLALHLAGKLPVMLNWTTGAANLAHAIHLMKVRRVVTSQRFLDRIGIKVQGTEFVFVEEIRKTISRWEQLRALLRVRWFPGSVRRLAAHAAPDRPAAVLFTSGSEKAPKAVPLTHANIITDQRASIQVLQLTRRHAVLAFLPPFHSFGLTVTGLLPLVTGLRVVCHPDPTDASALARKAAAYQTTILVGTPTFVSYILDRAEPGQLAALRLIVVGAEKCPEALFARCNQAAPEAQVLEGYGITECAPVVAVNRPGAARAGSVGQPLDCVTPRVVDLESQQPLPAGKMGMLWVSGPTIFPGYVGDEVPSPFQEADGKKWYVTGDLAELDADGFIFLRGRLKRFLKAGGEMISLPALEEPFIKLYPPTQDGPRVAVEGVERDGGRRIVLFSTEPLSLRDANALLTKEGFSGIMRLDEVRKIDAIPVLGTGKTDYKVLRGLLQS
jgi:long-chain-fatty-acid--[acyl-carrier-protein] ligase